MQKTVKQITFPPRLERKKRVAAYARVSTGKDAMLHSLSAQVSYYSQLIQNNPDWQYVGVYSDEAITGTKANRPGFQSLIDDCRGGKIDLIITKSISRFARNTVTLLETVRMLKELGVDVYFEEQNIYTMSADGELMLTILASYAQEESLSASENQKWRIRKGFENGELMNLRFLFGYRISKGKVEIDPETAPIVVEIFERVIAGETFGAIAKDLNERGLCGVRGGYWYHQRIRDIVSNEKYTGNALLQKCYVNNHIEKKEVRNRGELPQFYAEDTHPAIIDLETFEKAQAVLHRVKKRFENKAPQQKTAFSGKIICGKCGACFKQVKSNSTPGWNCATYQTRGRAKCQSKKIPEVTLISVTTEVLGLTAFDEETFTALIEHIEVPADNQLRFIFKNGLIAERTWKDRSRRESWTQEKREAAAKRTSSQRRKKQCQE